MNKILVKDREAFQLICEKLRVSGHSLIFETASAQGAPVDADELINNSPHLTQSINVMKSFQELCWLIFPGDREIELMLEMNEVDVRLIRNKWIEIEETMRNYSQINPIELNRIPALNGEFIHTIETTVEKIDKSTTSIDLGDGSSSDNPPAPVVEKVNTEKSIINEEVCRMEGEWQERVRVLRERVEGVEGEKMLLIEKLNNFENNKLIEIM
jgi:hypothetical protein